MTHSPPVKPVPATVHGEGVWLHNYPISALRGVRPFNPFFAPRSRCRMMRPREAMSAADTHLGPVPPSPMTRSASQILRSGRLCHHTRAVGSKGVTVDYCGPVDQSLGSRMDDASSGAPSGRRQASRGGPTVKYDWFSLYDAQLHRSVPSDSS